MGSIPVEGLNFFNRHDYLCSIEFNILDTKEAYPSRKLNSLSTAQLHFRKTQLHP
jgi:hypothetical protein